MDGFRWRLLFSWMSFLILACTLGLSCYPEEGEAESGWARAIGPRTWRLPRDHGSHSQYRTEWWYFTGNLSDSQRRHYGYQLTFFRQGIRLKASNPANPWSVRDLYFAHFATTERSTRRFRWTELASRAGPGLAGARSDRMEVWILNWSVKMIGSVIFLKARDDGMAISLELKPKKPLILHGKNGLSKKGPNKGQASYYVSLTDLDTHGFLKTQPDGPRLVVRGKSWFDHEFGSNQLASDQEGWDWFSLHLSDGRDLMVYLIRRKDGSIEPASSGTLIESNGSSIHLENSEILISVLDRWRSPRSDGLYPSRWRIRIPKARIDMVVWPVLADQELNTEVPTGVIYWEGAVVGEGASGSQAVSCKGYVELTGYAGSIGGVF